MAQKEYGMAGFMQKHGNKVVYVDLSTPQALYDYTKSKFMEWLKDQPSNTSYSMDEFGRLYEDPNGEYHGGKG